MMPESTEERKHLIAQLKGKIAHKTGKEKEEAYRKYWEAEHGKPMPICNLPITSRLRYSGTASQGLSPQNQPA